MLRFAVLLAICAGFLWADAKSVTTQEARQFVRAALPEWAVRAGPVYIREYQVPSDPDFYFFHAYRNNPGGSGTVGHFAVQRTTGDVWDGVVCEEKTNIVLAHLQNSIRKRLGLSDSEYMKLRRKGPFCD